MTFVQVQLQILNRSDIELRHDKKGREYAVFWSRSTGWTRCNMNDAKMILAQRAEASEVVA